MLWFHLFLLIVFSFVLIKATDILVEGLRSLADSIKIGRFALTSFILALATSLPELFVGLSAAFRGKPTLSLGNVLGSNIANLSLVIGGASLVAGSVQVFGEILYRDIYYGFLIGTAPLVLLLDNRLGRKDGLILLLLYAWYNLTILRGKRQEMWEKGWIRRLLHQFLPKEHGKEWTKLFLGVILLLLSAEGIVKTAEGLALGLGIPLFLVGLFLVAIGTSLPELAFEMKAIRRKETSMVFGDLLGSVVANSSLVLGLVALISPIKIAYLNEYLVATIFFILIFGAFYLFVRTKRKLERWEGGGLLLFYLLFVLFEFLKR